jgi:hypothetical protein
MAMGTQFDCAMSAYRGVIVEQPLELHVEISPMTLYLTNTTAAQGLFACVAKCAAVNNEAILIDCYCGLCLVWCQSVSPTEQLKVVTVLEQCRRSSENKFTVQIGRNVTFSNRM